MKNQSEVTDSRPVRNSRRLLARMRGNRRRGGSIQTCELLLIFPIVTILAFSIVEFSLLLASKQRVELASAAACRVATLPSHDAVYQREAVARAVDTALGKPQLVASRHIDFRPGWHTGDPVVVSVRVPMQAAAPDLLRIFGLTLKGRTLTSRTTMRKE